MDFLELVRDRYSCRKYLPKGVESEKIEYIMECVRLAPSAVNRQPWRFRIIDDEDGMAKLRQCYSREWFDTAPMYVIASVLHDEQWVRADGKPHGDIDVSIAVEHLCLAATHQGLATCWVCNFDVNLCRQSFSLPDNEEPVVLIPLGYSAQERPEKKRKAMADIVCHECK